MPRRTRARTVLPALLTAAALGLTSCGTGASAASDGRLDVVAAFYPLQFASEQIGGHRVDVTGLTKPGAEPHELELTPREVGEVSKAQVVVYEKGLQPAVDQAVAAEAPDTSLDVAPDAHLDLALQPALGHDHGAEVQEREAGEKDEAGATDPHFWLDPIRYRHVAGAIAKRFAQADPAHAAGYRARAKAFEAELTRLDRDFRTGLAHCARRDLVTSHSAFGYLAQRYHLQQVGITGISPDAEPDPAQIAAVARYVERHDVTTVYSETLVSPATADTVAKETGATVRVLDPVEGLTDQSAGDDYFQVMRSNLEALRAGQGCR